MKHKTDISPWRIMAPVKGQITVAIVLSVLSCISGMAFLLSMSLLFRDLVETGICNYYALTAVFVFAGLSFYLRLQSFNQSHYASYRLETILRKQLTDTLSRAPLGSIITAGSGKIAKILKDDVHGLHVFVADSTPLYARAYFMPIMTFAVLCFIDLKMAAGALAVLLIGIAVLSAVMRRSGSMHREYNLAREEISNTTVEFVQAMPVVRTFGGDETSFRKYTRSLTTFNGMLKDWFRKAGTAARTSMLVLNPLPTLVVLLWLGFYLYNTGMLSFSQWQAVLLIGTGMAEALMPYISLYHMIEKAKISAMRIFDLQNTPILPAPEKCISPVDNGIEFSNVSFRYPEQKEFALADVSFTLPPNSFTAVVGPSGSGKTTLSRLIPRFWDVGSGSIAIGGADVRSIAADELTRQISPVFQDNFLFSGTIAENICLGSDADNREAMISAAKTACIHDFVMTLEKGYDTEVGERGAFLSGGQIQRLTIARAVMQNRPIIIFDEATAYADAENEALLTRSIRALTGSKTVLMIAHRLSSVTDAGNILVMDQGRLVEQGTHQALLAQNGLYARLQAASATAESWTISNQTPVPAENGVL